VFNNKKLYSFLSFVILAIINHKLFKNEKKINPNIIYFNSWLRK